MRRSKQSHLSSRLNMATYEAARLVTSAVPSQPRHLGVLKCFNGVSRELIPALNISHVFFFLFLIYCSA